MLFQQGDVLIESAVIPASAKKSAVNKCGVVLAEGETTGHAHVITDGSAAILLEDNDTMYLRVIKETTLTHEEHKKITIPPGEYSVRKVQEYDHFMEESREVVD
jgi:hypothetical protein